MDLRSVDLNLLVVLERLLARGSVTAAARDLRLSQPAVSRSLERLRELFADPLLVRSGRGLVPTPRAQSLSAPLAEALTATRAVFHAHPSFDPAQAQGEFTLALGDELIAGFGPAIACAVWAAAPGVDLRVRRLGVESVEHGRLGLVDLAITPDLGPLPARAGGVDLGEFHARRLYTRRFCVAWSPRHPRPPPDLDAYCAARHVIVSFEGGGIGFVDDLLAASGRRRRVAASVPSFTAAAALVAATDLLATLPSEAAVGLCTAPPPLTLPELPVLLAWHPRLHADPRHRFLRERVAAAVGGAP